MISLLIAFIFSFLSSSITVDNEDFHAIYISVLEIDQPSKSIKIKIFANDLEDAIFNRSKQRVDLMNQPCANNKLPIEFYFEDHLQIKVDGKLLNSNLQSCEVNDASIWLTFTFEASNTWRTVEVNADYLMELFPTQSNVVSVFYKGEKKMFRLSKGDSKYSTTFK